jgi:hypothetical protein
MNLNEKADVVGGLGINFAQFRFYCQPICSGTQESPPANTGVSISLINTLQSELSMWITNYDPN